MSWWNIISPSGSAPIGSPFSRMLDAHQVLLRQVLAGKHDDQVIEPRLVDRAHRLGIGFLPQVDPTQFGPDVPSQRNDVEFGLGPRRDGHGRSPKWRRWSLAGFRAGRLAPRARCGLTSPRLAVGQEGP
jgi:hypothetical protein